MKKNSKYSEYKTWFVRMGLIGMFFLIYPYALAHAEGEPDLTIVKTHTGTFSPLDVGRTYTITVSNIGDSPTSGIVTVVDTLPTGLSATSMNGDGWTCVLATLTCTRNDALENGFSYPDITVTVNVLIGAPALITNQADVSGGGEIDFTNNTSLDDTNVNAKADLEITGYQLLNSDRTQVITQPEANETFWIRMTVENKGGKDTENFYPGVFLDDKPNFGPDHDSTGLSIPGYPVVLTLGEVTDYQGYKWTYLGAMNGAGCRYYDPSNLVTDPRSTEVAIERGNYHPNDFLPGLPAGEFGTVDVQIAYPVDEYPSSVYDNIREGLPAGSYSMYLYTDSGCNVDESLEENNALPITVNVGTAVTTLRAIFYSNGSQDGWVLESSETSEVGGTVNPNATVVTVGDDASDRQYRTMLSFDTSSLPDTAVISQAVLSLRVYEVLGGGNPIKVFNYFMADVKTGWFGSSSALAAQDFINAPTITSGPLGALNRGGWYYVDIKTGKTAVNTTGLTQVRLRFTYGDDDNGISNIINIYSGNSVVKPQLSLWYYVP